APPWIPHDQTGFWSVMSIGTAALVLVPVALVLQPRRAVFWLLLAVAMVMMALGPIPHLHRYLPRAGSPMPGPPGPHLVAMKLLPLFASFRAPYRWMAAAQIAVAMLVGLAVAGLRARLGPTFAAAALALVVAAVTIDVRGAQLPLVGTALPDAYGILIDD